MHKSVGVILAGLAPWEKSKQNTKKKKITKGTFWLVLVKSIKSGTPSFLLTTLEKVIIALHNTEFGSYTMNLNVESSEESDVLTLM